MSESERGLAGRRGRPSRSAKGGSTMTTSYLPGGAGTNLTLAFCGPLPAGLSGWPQRLLGRQLEIRPAAYHLSWDWSAAPKSGPPGIELEEISMNWTAPVVTEVCAGMEVTAYLSAEM
jgi:coenzyme PQQ precursor peptide PqqA